MRLIIFSALLITCSANTYAVEKTLTATGRAKLESWAQKVSRIYATALKNVGGISEEKDLDVYVYAYGPGGFTTAGYVKTHYSNLGISSISGCSVGGTTPFVPTPVWLGYPANATTFDNAYGPYVATPQNIILFQPYAVQYCYAVNYNFGGGMGNLGATNLARSSCVNTLRILAYNADPSPCANSPQQNLQIITYTPVSEAVCLATVNTIPPFQPLQAIPCGATASIETVKTLLQSYRGYVAACNANVIPSELNTDLIELDAVLAELNTGVALLAADIQGDTNPAPANNPWTYRKPALAIDGIASQTHLVGNVLPEQFKVKVTNPDGTTPNDIPIGFSVSGAPSADWAFQPGQAGQPVTRYTVNGSTGTGFKLGSAAGIYPIKASCADCCPAEVVFTAAALTTAQATELSLVQCDTNATIDMPLKNAFVVRAYNTITRKGEAGLLINYSKTSFPPGAEGQDISPESTLSNSLGLAKGNIKTGNKTGSYVFRADCPSCGGVNHVSCSVSAGPPPDLVVMPADDGPEAGDPNETPMLRISNIGYPNDTVSFTTQFGENQISLAADLKPDTPEYNALSMGIAWDVTDSDTDGMESGDPQNPADGPATDFYVNNPYVPTADNGRILPLKYKIQASVMTPKGPIFSYPRHIKQDAIDKCRQEYIDFGIPLTEVPRSTFTYGTHIKYASQLDCYAYIYPSRADEVERVDRNLDTITLNVTSGYRSPRANKLKAKSTEEKTSWHMFGKAIDLEPLPENATNYQILWNAFTVPKMLEKKVEPNVILKRLSSGELVRGSETRDNDGNGLPDVFEQANWMHLGE